MTHAELAAAIISAVTEADPDRASRWGVRVDCGVSYDVGDVAEVSRVWDDGEPTDDTLDGTSALDAATPARAAFAARQILGGYLAGLASTCEGAPVVVLLRSDWAAVGDDPGEIVMRDAEVAAVWPIAR